MERTKMVFAALVMMGAAGGCTRDNVGHAPLDQPAEVKATGAQPASMLTMYRKGVLDPAGSLDDAGHQGRVGALHDAARQGDGAGAGVQARRRQHAGDGVDAQGRQPAQPGAAHHPARRRADGAAGRERRDGARPHDAHLQGGHDPRRRLAVHARRDRVGAGRFSTSAPRATSSASTSSSTPRRRASAGASPACSRSATARCSSRPTATRSSLESTRPRRRQ